MFPRKLVFLIFNKHVWPRIAWDEQARAILKTLLSQVYPVAVTASRREVATHVATFVLGEKCPMSCESIGRHPCSLRLVLRVQ